MSPNPTEDGMITFGGYDISKFAKQGAKESDIFWADMEHSEKYWTVPMQGAMFDRDPTI